MLEIAAVRLVAADDQTHHHIDLVGYLSPHLPDEPIMIDIPRVAQRIALGEKFVAVVDGEQAEVSVGKCARCGHEPYLRTTADTGENERLLDLPPK
ncbi:MAG: hypothetical protein WDA27_03350 [Actinomycetota bacterium]